MKARLVNGRALAVASLLLLMSLLSAAAPARAAAETHWFAVRSENFLFVGNAREQEVRQVATRLEQFRDLFTRLLARDYLTSNVPATVFVFKDDASYKPFKPLYKGAPADVAGHFRSSADMDYLLLSLDRRARGSRSPYFLVIHEYVHLLVKNFFPEAPVWFNEGLAEYYSTLRASDAGRRITLGQFIESHARTLRDREMLPLEALFAVEHDSPDYNDPKRRRIFYAQSWALVHYLLNGNNGARRTQLSVYLDLLASNTSPAESFHKAFGTDPASLENELKAYVRLGVYPERNITFDQKFDERIELQSKSITEAESETRLGDYLLHTERFEESEAYLQRGVALDPKLATAQSALGLLRLRQNRLVEARQHLERAVALDPQDYRAHYRYASALSREGMDERLWVTDYAPETAELIRAELKKTIDLAPRFVEAYRLLAFVNLVRDERLDEATAHVKQGLSLAPRRGDLALLLAQIQLRREEFGAARETLSALARKAETESLRERARAMLLIVARREELIAARRAADAGAAERDMAASIGLQPCDMAYTGAQHKRLRFDGEQRCGMLVRVECEDDGVLLFVNVNDRLLTLRSNALNRIRFVTYTADVRGQITCGLREPANPVLVTFRSISNRETRTDGEVIAVEFVPKSWYGNN